MHIEEFDDLIDQCDIQDTFDKASTLHPYLHIRVRKDGTIDNDADYIKECLRTKVISDFRWANIAHKRAKINEFSFWCHFEMWVRVDKYNYDYDKIVKVVMDTRAKMIAERKGL